MNLRSRLNEVLQVGPIEMKDRVNYASSRFHNVVYLVRKLRK